MLKKYEEYTNKELNEFVYAGTHQERFNRAIYLTYVEHHRNFKPVSEEEFHNIIPSADKITSVEFDKNNIHRLADKKESWWIRGQVAGEIWSECDNCGCKNCSTEGEVTSYWVNQDLIKFS